MSVLTPPPTPREQIMLGLIGEGTGIAAKVLKSMGEYTERGCFPHPALAEPYPLCQVTKFN